MLIDILRESLDDDLTNEIESKWAAESEARIDAVDRGELQTIDGPFALGDLRSSLRNDAISVCVARVSSDFGRPIRFSKIDTGEIINVYSFAVLHLNFT